LMEHSTSVVVPKPETGVTPDTSPEPLSTVALEHRPGEALQDATAAGLITFDPHGSTLPEALLQVLTLTRRWELATSAEQREFVAYHRDELQRLLTRPDRQKAVSP
jgi:hypothetical protein